MFHFLFFLLVVFCLIWMLYQLLVFLANLPRNLRAALVELWKNRRAVLASLLKVAALILFYAGAFWFLNVLVEDPPLQYGLWVLNACIVVHYLVDRYLNASKGKFDE